MPFVTWAQGKGPHARETLPYGSQIPGGTYLVCPFSYLFLDVGMEQTGGDGCPLPFTLGHCLSLPWDSLQCPLVAKSGQNLWADWDHSRRHDLLGRPEH